jgi:hypothetical protein
VNRKILTGKAESGVGSPSAFFEGDALSGGEYAFVWVAVALRDEFERLAHTSKVATGWRA